MSPRHRQLVGAWAALLLLVSATGILPLFAPRASACCCERDGQHRGCQCADCSRNRDEGCSRLGKCSAGAALAAIPPLAERPYLAAENLPQPAAPRPPQISFERPLYEPPTLEVPTRPPSGAVAS
jgi:hypothetical protein